MSQDDHQMPDPNVIMETLLKDPECKEAFDKRASKGQLKLEDAGDVLNDLSIIFNFDCEPAIVFFDRDSSPLPPEQLRDNIDFPSFCNIFKQWLNYEEEPEGGQKSQQLPADKDYWFKDEPTHPTDHHHTTEGSDARDMRQHEQLISLIFDTHSKATYTFFQQYADIGESGGGKAPTIHKTDFPLLLRNLLYNENASLYEKEGQEDFFMRNNTFKNLEEFVGDKSDDKQKSQASNSDRLNYEQFKEAAIQFIRKHPDLIIMDHERANQKKEKQSGMHEDQSKPASLEQDLLNQIERYQQHLQSTNNEVEKQVVRNMITTLVKQLDLIREAQLTEQPSIINTTMAQQKKTLMISFSGIPRPTKRQVAPEEKQDLMLEKQLQEIFLFFCQQQYVSGAKFSFDRFNAESSTLSLGMFIYFCNCFGLMEDKHRVPYEINQLEKKRRGIVDEPQKKESKHEEKDKNEEKDAKKGTKEDKKKEAQGSKKKEEKDEKDDKQKEDDDDKKDDPKDRPKDGKGQGQKKEGGKPAGDSKPVDGVKKIPTTQLQTIPENKKFNKSVESKFQWWNDDVKFEKYYNPVTDTHIPQKPVDIVHLKRDQIVRLFKKLAFGKDMDFNEFKQMLGVIATKMFKNPEKPDEIHPNPYKRLLEELKIGQPEEYKRHLKSVKVPFNCTEKDNFREAPWREGKEYKGHSFNEQEKQKLKLYQFEKDQQLREKLTEVRTNQNNQSLMSLGNVSMSSVRSKTTKNYVQVQSQKAGKLDLNRDKVSWDKLEVVNYKDLGGINSQQFRPQDLIDNIDDDEDRMFLQEFDLGVNNNPPQVDYNHLESYGSIRNIMRPTQKYMLDHSRSQPQMMPDRYGPNTKSLKHEYLARAQQIQNDQLRREQSLMQHLDQEMVKKNQLRLKPNKAY